MSAFRKKRRRKEIQEIVAEPASTADYSDLPDAVQALFGLASADKTVDTRKLLPVSAAIADEAAEKLRRTEQEIDDLLKGKGNSVNWIGKPVNDEGIFIGRFSLRDCGKTFNIFAAPADLSNKPLYYQDTVLQVAGLKKWHGHDGMHYEEEAQIYAALRNGSYSQQKGWIIPPAFLLEKESKLKNAFNKDNGHAGYHPGWYWSCTENFSLMRFVQLSDGWQGKSSKEQKLSCRPIRLVEVKP